MRQDAIKLKEVCLFTKVPHLFHEMLAKLGVVPFMYRHAEALFFSIDQVVRDHTPYRSFQNIFGHSVFGFHGFRNAHCQLYKFVVEKGHACFQADCHAHLVHTHEQQFRQP